MRAMPAADTPLLKRSAPHNARSFAVLPDADRAVGLLDELAGTPCAFSPVPMDRPLALYGAGDLGRLAREFLTSVGHDFAMAVDRNADELARDPYWSGVQLMHPDKVPQAAKHDVPYRDQHRHLALRADRTVAARTRLRRCRALLRSGGKLPRRTSAVERLVRAGADVA